MFAEVTEFLQGTYYGSTLRQWFIALGLIVVSVVLGRLLYWISGRWIKMLASRTSSRIDDILVDMLEEPLVGLFIVVGVRYSLSFLSLDSNLIEILDQATRFAITLLITWLLVRLYDAVHREYLVKLAEGTETDLDDQLLPVLRNGVRFLLFVLGGVVALNNAGFDVGAVLAGLGIGGLAFALAGQDTVANLFGGVTILVQRPFKLKDRIMVSGVEGYVDELGLRTTQLKSISGEKIQIPNKFFIASTIQNLDDCDYYFGLETFLLHRNTSGDQVDRLLSQLNELRDEHEDVMWCLGVLNGLNEFGMEVQLAYGVHRFQHSEKYFNHLEKKAVVKTFLNRRTYDLLKDNSIKMANPVYLGLRRKEDQ